MSKMSIFEVLEYGPIVAKNEELGILITVNGSYFNFWVGDGQTFTCSECFSLSSDNGLYGYDIVKLMDRAEAIIKEEIEKLENEE